MDNVILPLSQFIGSGPGTRPTVVRGLLPKGICNSESAGSGWPLEEWRYTLGTCDWHHCPPHGLKRKNLISRKLLRISLVNLPFFQIRTDKLKIYDTVE